MSIFGALIGAGSSILGGLLGDKAAKKANAQQMDLAKNSVKYRVEDATRAGVHPLYAMGAPTLSSSHVVSPLPAALSDMGQNLSRAVDAGLTGKQRADGYTLNLQRLQLERGALENELLRSQIRNANSPQLGPAGPGPGDRPLIDGQGDTRTPVRLLDVLDKVQPRKAETPHQDLENEYGEAANVVSAIRAVRDWSPSVDNYLFNQWQKVLRGEENDLLTVRLPSWLRKASGGRGW